jgi:p-aminobenzoyl-glutamate transporter AbgT
MENQIECTKCHTYRINVYSKKGYLIRTWVFILIVVIIYFLIRWLHNFTDWNGLIIAIPIIGGIIYLTSMFFAIFYLVKGLLKDLLLINANLVDIDFKNK